MAGTSEWRVWCGRSARRMVRSVERGRRRARARARSDSAGAASTDASTSPARPLLTTVHHFISDARLI